ncbi:MAG: site-specific DNA-methyltransferase, partial [Bacillus sp. (in: Bacteria)]|nr:site-specific DNA-methyltransferase [Bacillus sp. (in: firmicutes)]
MKKLIGQQKQTQGLPSLTKNKPGTQISRLSFKKEWIETNLPDGIYKAGKLNSGYILHNDVIVSNGKVQNDFDLSGKVIWSQSYLEDEIKKGTKIVIKTKDFIPYSKKIETSDLAPTTLIPDNEVGDVLAGNSDINELFQAKVFEHPKPVSLLKYLLYSINDEFALILDFFAGSGTTGDAVMQLNAEDGGNRKFILVQLPEPIDPKKNKTAYD